MPDRIIKDMLAMISSLFGGLKGQACGKSCHLLSISACYQNINYCDIENINVWLAYVTCYPLLFT